MNNIGNVSMHDVTYNLDHVEVVGRLVARQCARKANGQLLGISLDVDAVQKSVCEQIELLAGLAGQGHSAIGEYRLLGVISELWPLMRDTFPAERSGNGLTARLKLAARELAKPVGKVEGLENLYRLNTTASILETLESVGTSSGIATSDAPVDGGGNFDVLSATAEWKDETCFVYHSGQLSNAQLLLIASLSIHGHDKLSYGRNPEVAKTLVVAEGMPLLQLS